MSCVAKWSSARSAHCEGGSPAVRDPCTHGNLKAQAPTNTRERHHSRRKPRFHHTRSAQLATHGRPDYRISSSVCGNSTAAVNFAARRASLELGSSSEECSCSAPVRSRSTDKHRELGPWSHDSFVSDARRPESHPREHRPVAAVGSNCLCGVMFHPITR